MPRSNGQAVFAGLLKTARACSFNIGYNDRPVPDLEQKIISTLDGPDIEPPGNYQYCYSYTFMEGQTKTGLYVNYTHWIFAFYSWKRTGPNEFVYEKGYNSKTLENVCHLLSSQGYWQVPDELKQHDLGFVADDYGKISSTFASVFFEEM